MFFLCWAWSYKYSHIVKKVIFLLLFFSFVRHGSDNWVYSNDGRGRIYQNCKFDDYRGRAFLWGWGGEGLKYVYFWWPVSINSKLLAIVIRIYNATYLCQCWFCLFILWWACLYANMSPSDKESVKSLWYMYRLGLWASRLFYKDVFFTGNYVKDDKDNCNGSFKLLPRAWIREDNQQAANRT